jgi:xanthine/uracil permease
MPIDRGNLSKEGWAQLRSKNRHGTAVAGMGLALMFLGGLIVVPLVILSRLTLADALAAALFLVAGTILVWRGASWKRQVRRVLRLAARAR